jgi:hypothetical protein
MPINKLSCCSIQFIEDTRRGQTTKVCTKQQFADTIYCCSKSTAKQRQRKPGHKGKDIEHFGQVSLPINFYVSVPTEGNAQSLSRADLVASHEPDMQGEQHYNLVPALPECDSAAGYVLLS